VKKSVVSITAFKKFRLKLIYKTNWWNQIY